tara:strand:+ start:1175 stop:2863 length:1689 start_codon:yes stop_codon:yes gene_type:complete
MTRAREAARLIGNNTFRLDSNNAVGFNSTTPDAMFDINAGLTVAGVITATSFSGTVTTATNVTVADESSDTTCFPVFVTAATGDLAPKSGTNLTFNSSTGTLETTNVTVTGDLTVQGTTTTLDTALQEVDLINVQANASVPGLGVTQSGSGAIIAAYDGASEVFRVDDGGNVGIGTDNAATKLHVQNSIVVSDQDTSQNSANPAFQAKHDGTINGSWRHDGRLEVGGQDSNATIRLNPDGTVGINTITPGRQLTVSGGASEGVIQITNNTSGFAAANGFELLHFTSGETQLLNRENGDMRFDTNATERLRITAAGLVRIPDTGKFTCGAGDDLEIYHNGSASFIHDNGTGDLNICFESGSKLVIQSGTSGNHIAEFKYEGAAELFHNGNKRFETTADGADFSGTGSIKVPVGTTAQRNSSPTAGDFRYNSETGGFEGYTTEWGAIAGSGGGGITTTASAPSANTIVYLDLGAAQYHELALSAGITTISCSNGTVGDSHVVVINQPSSGIATVGFDTYFEFPSGAAPGMSEGGSKVDMVSFVVKKAAGAGGTELLASAGLNYQ